MPRLRTFEIAERTVVVPLQPDDMAAGGQIRREYKALSGNTVPQNGTTFSEERSIHIEIQILFPGFQAAPE